MSAHVLQQINPVDRIRKLAESGQLPRGIKVEALSNTWYVRGRRSALIAAGLCDDSCFPNGLDSRGRVVRHKGFELEGRRIGTRTEARSELVTIYVGLTAAEKAEGEDADEQRKASEPARGYPASRSATVHNLGVLRGGNTVATLETLLSYAKAGDVVGVAVVWKCIDGKHGNTATGECLKDAVNTVGALEQLKYKLLRVESSEA